MDRAADRADGVDLCAPGAGAHDAGNGRIWPGGGDGGAGCVCGSGRAAAWLRAAGAGCEVVLCDSDDGHVSVQRIHLVCVSGEEAAGGA